VKLSDLENATESLLLLSPVWATWTAPRKSAMDVFVRKMEEGTGYTPSGKLIVSYCTH
jgi:hypothetical protein